MRFIQICSDCRTPEDFNGNTMRIWEEVRCPGCRRFYCRKVDCLGPLVVEERDTLVHCRRCGTGHRFSGLGFGKICVDRPILGAGVSGNGVA